MTKIILNIFDYLRRHRTLRVLSLMAITLLIITSVLSLHYKEDISDFLPLEQESRKALSIYQDISGAGRFFFVFSNADTTSTNPDAIVEYIESLQQELSSFEGKKLECLWQIDLEKMEDILSFAYKNIPYFLDEKDYSRIDSLLTSEHFIHSRLQSDAEALMTPVGGTFSETMEYDPLGLFTPVISDIGLSSLDSDLAQDESFELYEGYIFSKDMKMAVASVISPFGSSETENNARLLKFFESKISKINSQHSDAVECHITGGPAIAVGNASCIKRDSIISVTLALVLILSLLFVVFRKIKNILLIGVSVLWGWLFAVGALALVNNEVSIIVLGISSVILGIAVNYPLHLIAHTSHTPDIRTALKEIITPLIVGNITTIGAFLCLVPLRSVALRDLGLFSSFLLIGTMLFVVLYLPHAVSGNNSSNPPLWLEKLGEFHPEKSKILIVVVLILTVVFGWYSLSVKFDSDMSNINYMSDAQKQDMVEFQSVMSGTSMAEGTSEVFVVSSSSVSVDKSLDNALALQPLLDSLQHEGIIQNHKGCSKFIVSKPEQERRLQLWDDFKKRYGDILRIQLLLEGQQAGFSTDAFSQFFDILSAEYHPKSFDYFRPLVVDLFSGYISQDNNLNIVDKVYCKTDDVSKVEDMLRDADTGRWCFDVHRMNSAIADHLSDDFNYIGWACGFIVFFFLWFSFGSIELAILSFLPMAISWVWILGIMSMLDIHFNIVNIILATFIFGQGDDYTIFMTEGCCYEYAYKKKMLSSYKTSIVISALIMFIGIGSLIFAKHPALHSLAQVTIIGMFSVVFMAYLLPPLIFRWLTYGRKRPVSLLPLLAFSYNAVVFFAQLAVVHIVGLICHHTMFFRRFVSRLFRWDMSHLPGVRYDVISQDGYPISTDFAPKLFICNHQSMLDSSCLMALSEKFILVSNGNPEQNFVVRQIYRWLDFYTLSGDIEKDASHLETLVKRGYSIAMFPEGKRNPDSSILRFHKGAEWFSHRLGLDIGTIFLHGHNLILPRNSFCQYSGTMMLEVGKTFPCGTSTSELHDYFVQHYNEIKQKRETAEYFRSYEKDMKRYKNI